MGPYETPSASGRCDGKCRPGNPQVWLPCRPAHAASEWWTVQCVRSSWERETPNPGRPSLIPYLQDFCSARGDRYSAARILGFAERYVQAVIANVLPTKPMTLFWAQSAIDQNRRNIPKQIWVLQLDGVLASLCGPYAFTSPLIGSKHFISDTLRRAEIPSDLQAAQSALPTLLTGEQRNLGGCLLRSSPLHAQSHYPTKHLKTAVRGGAAAARSPAVVLGLGMQAVRIEHRQHHGHGDERGVAANAKGTVIFRIENRGEG